MTGTNTTAVQQAQKSAPARDAQGRLLKGHSMGRPQGAKGKRGTAYLDQLHERGAKAWDVIDQRLDEGCGKTAQFVLGRLLPSERTVQVPGTDAKAWAEAMAAGDLTVGEAQRAAAAIKALSDTEELRELKERLDQLETALQARVDGRLCRS